MAGSVTFLFCPRQLRLSFQVLTEGNFRYDGSSKFQPENRWAFFWGVSAGWRLSEEALIKNLNIFDDLKLRVSYGTVGNQGGIDCYDGLQLYNSIRIKAL